MATWTPDPNPPTDPFYHPQPYQPYIAETFTYDYYFDGVGVSWGGTPVTEESWMLDHGPLVPQPASGMAVLETREGRYLFATDGVNIEFAQRLGPEEETGDFDFSRYATPGWSGNDPDLEQLAGDKIILVSVNSHGGLFNYSDDGGFTWSTAVAGFEGATHLRVRKDIHGTALLLAVTPTDPTIGDPTDLANPVYLKGMIQRKIDRWPNDNQTNTSGDADSFDNSSDPAFWCYDADSGTVLPDPSNPPDPPFDPNNPDPPPDPNNPPDDPDAMWPLLTTGDSIALDRASDGTFRMAATMVYDDGAGTLTREPSASHWWSEDRGLSWHRIGPAYPPPTAPPRQRSRS
jgi:hypothetical protein